MQTARITCYTGLFGLIGALIAGCQPAGPSASFGRPADVLPASAEVRRLFADPPREYSSGPLWVWNDLLTEEQVVRTLRELREQHIRQVWVHPRPGLMTPYLSDEWFRLWKAALEEGKRLDMNVWIYDENSYPSGFAGGFVPEAMPESRGQGLGISDSNEAPKWAEDIIAIHRLGDAGCENVTAQVRAGNGLPQGKYIISRVGLAPITAWHGQHFYVDLIRPGVTEKFIELTFEPYRKHLGDEFGKHIPGTFTDEPKIQPAGGLAWTPDLPEQFKNRWGYELTDCLPSLAREVGDWRRVRHDYYATLLDLFNERWGKPMHDYCQTNRLAFTGHYWEHEWPNCGYVPDNMSLYQWFHVPGIDTLMNQYNEGTHAQFGNVRAVRELASVANQLGMKRTLCEAYGAAGWDIRFEDMKRIGDWLCALGVNTLNQHLSFITIRGARKRDHPQSLTPHAPWWQAYHIQADYFARLCAALSAGEQVNHTLVIEPTTTAWMYQLHANLKELGDVFQKLVVALDQRQVEYDLGSEDLIGRFGSVHDKRLTVGRRSYDLVVIPPMTETLRGKTIDLLVEFLKSGGRVMCAGQPPRMADGRPSERLAASIQTGGWQQVDAARLSEILLAEGSDGLSIRQAEGNEGIVYHMRRRMADGELLFVVNTSIEHPAAGTIEASAGGIERWDPQNGSVKPFIFEKQGSGVRASFDLPPCGSLLLFISRSAIESAPVVQETVETIAPAGGPDIRRNDPNVLTLDYVDISVGKENRQNIYFFKANEMAFLAHGLKGNPWDRSVQFRDQFLKMTFPQESGFTVQYRFTIAGEVPKELWFVLERPDLYAITCNGQPVTVLSEQWWLEPSFGKIDVRTAAKVGENVVTCKASPFSVWHEIEPAYVLGDFALEPTEKGFAIRPASPLKLGPWKEQGLPLYGHAVAYRERFDIGSPSGRYAVALYKWYGSVAKVEVNGRFAGYIQCQPWECDVTPLIKAGANEVAVTVIGTLKNTLGPHHGNPPAGLAWPDGFQSAPETGPPPGKTYSTFEYGLFEPFVLKQATSTK